MDVIDHLFSQISGSVSTEQWFGWAKSQPTFFYVL